MNIWLITVGEPLPSDGPNARLYRTGLLATASVQRGHNVTWWTSTFDHVKKIQRFAQDTTIVLAPNYKLKLLHSFDYSVNVSIKRNLNHIDTARVFSREAAIQESPDIILVSMPTLELAAAAVEYGERNKVPVLVDIRDLWPDIFLDLFPAWTRTAARIVLYYYFRKIANICRKATGITGITPLFVQWGLKYAGRTATVYDNIFPLGYTSAVPGEDLLRGATSFWESKGIGSTDRSKEFIVCFFGALGRQFDFETVVRAAQMLDAGEKKIRFVLCGTGANYKQNRERASGLDNILMPGWVGTAEIWTLMRFARVGLVPYHSTPDFEMSIPNKVIEYLSAGLPIISSLQGTVAELLSGERCGLTYRKGNPSDLAKLLAKMYDNPAELADMSVRAAEVFERDFEADKVYGRMIKHLELVCGTYYNK